MTEGERESGREQLTWAEKKGRLFKGTFCKCFATTNIS